MQRVGDVNDEKSNGQIFAFDSADEREREHILQHFGLPVTKANLDMLKYLKKGQKTLRPLIRMLERNLKRRITNRRIKEWLVNLNGIV